MPHVTAERKAPKQGYDYPLKAQYRADVWSAIATQLGPKKVPIAKVAILPSSEGLEIPLLLQLGFREENIYAIDSNPAILASARWRKQFPAVHVYGSAVEVALDRIRREGVVLDAANLDLCGGFTTPMIEAIGAALSVNVFQPLAVVALTMLKGREDPAVIAALRLFIGESTAETHSLRLDGMICHIRNTSPLRWIAPLAGGQYKSGTQIMEWTCLAFVSNAAPAAELRWRKAALAYETSRCLELDFAFKRLIKKQKVEFDMSWNYLRYDLARKGKLAVAKWCRIYSRNKDYKTRLWEQRQPLSTYWYNRAIKLIEGFHASDTRLALMQVTSEQVSQWIENSLEAQVPFPYAWRTTRGGAWLIDRFTFSDIPKPFDQWNIDRPITAAEQNAQHGLETYNDGGWVEKQADADPLVNLPIEQPLAQAEALANKWFTDHAERRDKEAKEEKERDAWRLRKEEKNRLRLTKTA